MLCTYDMWPGTSTNVADEDKDQSDVLFLILPQHAQSDA
jgi:hypothetical protein